MLAKAGLEDRVIYGAEDWPAFVLALRAGDRAVVADLRVFGSRRRLVEAAEAVAKRGAKLMAVETGTELDMPTLREVDRTLTVWRGESALKNPKRASFIGRRGAAARKLSIARERLDPEAARAIWKDERYQDAADALARMPGWTRTTAWRHFGARDFS
jgi:hypothetical protein